MRFYGYADILTHDGPAPIFLSGAGKARPLKMDYQSLGKAIIGEGNCQLQDGDTLVVVTDGITQAGLGRTCPNGWPEGQIADFINRDWSRGTETTSLARIIHQQALSLWSRTDGDDCTSVTLTLRPARQVSILTGPPSDPEDDAWIIHRFMNHPGRKIICGGTTSEIAARVLKRPLEILNQSASPWMPPAFRLEGIDLVTEGIIILNQLANLLTVHTERLNGSSLVKLLCGYLLEADCIHFLVGSSLNPQKDDTFFHQIGIVERKRILEILAQQLQTLEKLVITENF